MRNNRWLRTGLASLTIGGLALSAFVVACGDDDSGGGSSTSSSGTPGVDSGKADTGTPTDSGVDTGTDSGVDSGPTLPPAKLQLVNAATDFGSSNPLGALRICYKVGATTDTLIWATLPPLPNRKSGTLPFPGLFAGTGGPVDGTGVDLSKLVIRPYLLSAASLEAHGLGSTVTAGNDKLCQAIIEADAGGPFTENTDYWVLPDVPANTFLKGNSYLLVLTGCAGGSAAGTAKCGGDPGAAPGKGNLAINVYKVDTTTAVAADKLGVQFVSVSNMLDPALANINAALKTTPALMADKADAASATLIGSIDGGAPGVVPEFTQTTLVQVSGVTPGHSISPNPAVAPLAFSLPNVAALSFGVGDAGVYANGKAFTIVALGDPTLDPDGGNGGATFNTKFFHFLALPNDPAINAFDPAK